MVLLVLKATSIFLCFLCCYIDLPSLALKTIKGGYCTASLGTLLHLVPLLVWPHGEKLFPCMYSELLLFQHSSSHYARLGTAWLCCLDGLLLDTGRLPLGPPKSHHFSTLHEPRCLSLSSQDRFFQPVVILMVLC